MRYRQALAALLVFVAISCATGGGAAPPVVVPGRAALQIFVEPNPIRATRVSGNTYDFPFQIGIREIGGASVEIQRVGIEVVGLGAINLYSQTFNRDEIIRRGFPTTVPANGEIRYQFAPRKEVPDERLFSAVSAELFAEGTDGNGNQIRDTISVTVRR